MLLAGIVFILVPREVTSGEIRIFSDQMSWNSTKGTYQLDLLAHVPIYNPNYLAVRFSPYMHQAPTCSVYHPPQTECNRGALCPPAAMNSDFLRRQR